MPNWCEGNIRFRGKKADIVNFLKNEVAYVTNDGEEITPLIEEDEYDFAIYPPEGEMRDSFYFRNTKRNFIFSGSIEVCWPDTEEDEDIVVTLDNFNSAWSFKSDGWDEHAKKYNIDIRMFGFEQGMQFSQVMTITREGEVTLDSQEYDDWDWDCPFPNMGG